MKLLLSLAICLLLAGLSCGLAQARPYEFTEDLQKYTWGEDISKVLEELGEPYSQDSEGLTYIVNEHWVKRIQLDSQNRVWQVTDQLIYPLDAPEAQQEYGFLLERIEQIYGPPSSRHNDCPAPDRQRGCQVNRWDQHPSAQVTVARISTLSSTSVAMAYSSPDQRPRDASLNQKMDIEDIIRDYQQDARSAAQRYQGRELQVIGQNGGLGRDEDNKLYLTLHSAFVPNQQLRCYLLPDQEISFIPYRDAVSLLARGIGGEYKENILIMNNCRVLRP